MKAYVLLTNGFEILEAFSPVDILKRCGADVITVSIIENNLVESSQKNIIKTDKILSEINFDDGDLLILPGGYPGYVNLRENQKVIEIVKNYLEKNKYVAAICGAPTIFSYNKLALNRKITGHSSTKEELVKNHICTDTNTCIDGNIITGIGAGHSLDFGFLIAEQFFSKEKILEVKKGMELM